MEGIVYVLTNAAMPGLVKIGKTSRSTVGERMAELYSTGVPVPFECKKAVHVKDMNRVEKDLHREFQKNRTNPRREFFKIDPRQACAALECFDGVVVTTDINAEIRKTKGPAWHFLKMGIPRGATLVYVEDNEITVEVLDDRNVRFQNEEMKLTEATRRASEKQNPSRPGERWTYRGRTVDSYWEEWEEKGFPLD